ncbi:MAG: tyrosine-type recombinase/integrase, partial [Candidatus Dormibacteria bacterium]
MARRGSGEGTIYRRACDGIYVAALVVDGRRQYFYAKRRADVVRRLDEARRNTAQGMPVVAGTEATGAFLRAWVDGQRSAIRPTTWDAYDRSVRTAVPVIGGIPLAKLQPQHLQAFYEGRLRAGSSPATVNQVHRVLRTALAQAERWGLVPRNVASLATPPRAA